MNENDESNIPNEANVPPPITPDQNVEVSPSLPPQSPSRPHRPLSWWLRRFFACNPFYLVSAALLLYGCYRVSIDGTFVDRETARLLFNFSSVQVYELLLVGVAIFLARRCLWYDSMVLVGLENMLVFVPFILISLAALTGPTITVSVCAAAVILAVLRFGCLKRYFAELNLPGSLLGMGFILLALNVALPLTYRHYINLKIGVHLDAGPDYIMNECMWLLVLPAALALVNFLPRVQAQTRGELLPQRRWLPMGLFALWITVTGLHLWALDYVYGYYLRPDLFAPVGWVLAWTVFLRAPAKPVALKYALMFPAVLVPFLADTPGTEKTYLALMALNVAAFGVVRFIRGGNRLAGHLAYASALLFVVGLPDIWIQVAVHGATAMGCVAAGLAAYLIFWTAWLRDPKLAVLGAILFGVAIAVVFQSHPIPNVINWGLQGGFVFLLLHSLRWNDAEHAGAGASRIFFGTVWAIQSFVWMNCEGTRFWMPFIPGVVVLAFYCVVLPCRGVWRLFAIPVTAFAVVLSGPCCLAVERLRSIPAGLLAVIASFAFLGLGTVAALTREFWHHHEHKTETK